MCSEIVHYYDALLILQCLNSVSSNFQEPPHYTLYHYILLYTLYTDIMSTELWLLYSSHSFLINAGESIQIDLLSLGRHLLFLLWAFARKEKVSDSYFAVSRGLRELMSRTYRGRFIAYCSAGEWNTHINSTYILSYLSSEWYKHSTFY